MSRFAWFGVVSFVLFVSAAVHAEENETWEPVLKNDEIELRRKVSAGSSDLFAFRGVGILPYPPKTVAAGILDRARRPEWMRDIKELRVIRVNGTGHYLEYTWVRTPIVVKDRDFLIQTDVEVDQLANRIVIVSRSVVDPEVPPTSAVRGALTEGRFVIEPGPSPNTAKLTADMDVDPRGSVPKWITNHFQKNWPIVMFYSLKKFLARNVATIPDDVLPLFSPKPIPSPTIFAPRSKSG